MKRKTKILLTVLSVLLISGTMLSMLFASAADVSGVTVKSTQSFETISDDWFYTASDGTNPKVGNVTFQQGGRAGVLTAGNSLPYEKNKYVIITQDDKAERLQYLIRKLIGDVVEECNEKLLQDLSQNMVKELDYQFRLQEEREEQRENRQMLLEEEHYKQLDALIRNHRTKPSRKKAHSFLHLKKK